MAGKKASPDDNRRPAAKTDSGAGTDAIVREPAWRTLPQAPEPAAPMQCGGEHPPGTQAQPSQSVCIVGPEYEVLYSNPSLEAEFGPIGGRKCYQYLHDRGQPCPWCLGKAAAAGDTMRHEWKLAKTGKTYEVFATPIPSAEGAVSKIHILHDVTGRKQSEKALRESAVQLRAVSTHLLEAQETEKLRVSRKLHDELAQSLGSLKLRLGLLRNQLHEGQEEARTDCDDMRLYLDEAIETVRRLSRELLPTTLEDLGLGTALRRLLSKFSRDSQAKVVSRIEDVERLRSKEDEILTFRVFQEALNNVQKHGRARNVSVTLERRDREIHGLVEDDGAGFDPTQAAEKIPGTSGMGLPLMAERIRMLGGTLDVRSEPDKGTCITFSIPLRG
jgi:signal transduction histidine kinase